MCKSIEEYAINREIDAVIKNCIEHNDSAEETIKFVKKQFSKASKNYIISRYNSIVANNK